jgi:hypothetical protein
MMNTGLEKYSDSVIKTIIRNLKSGIIHAVTMSEEEFHATDGHAAPPAQAVQLNFMMLEIFQAEAFSRTMDYYSIGPDTREIEDKWLEARTKEH